MSRLPQREAGKLDPTGSASVKKKKKKPSVCHEIKDFGRFLSRRLT